MTIKEFLLLGYTLDRAIKLVNEVILAELIAINILHNSTY